MQPRIRVVICAWNEEEVIGQCIKSLMSQSIPVEIMVVNDGSTDGTGKIAKSIGESVCVIDVPPHGSRLGWPEFAESRNLGLDGWDGEYVSIVDADMLFPADYFETIISRMKDGVVVASGQIKGMSYTVPTGAGRVVDWKWWKTVGGKYPLNYGHEGWLLAKAGACGLKYMIYDDVLYTVARTVGANYSATSNYAAGKGFRALGYPVLHMLGVAILWCRFSPIGAFHLLRGFFATCENPYEDDVREYTRRNHALSWSKMRLFTRLARR